jgi:restriction system protein
MVFAVCNGVSWLFISDGEIVYSADRDVRYYSHPPTHSYSQSGNRIVQLTINGDDLLKLAAEKNFTVIRPSNFGRKLKTGTLPSLVGGGVGAVVLGPIGAALGASLGAFIGTVNPSKNASEKELLDVFSSCREKYVVWQNYDRQKRALEIATREEYIKKATLRWNKFHQLQSVSNIDVLSGSEFEIFLANMYNNLGYKTKLTKNGADWGVDIIAEIDDSIFAIQAKRYSSAVGTQAIQEIFAGSKYYNATHAIVVTNSRFTESAANLARKLGVALVDRSALLQMCTKAFPNKSIPQFTLDGYEQIKPKIDAALKSLKY